jgi:three-Cys-motif partner protein
MSSKNLFDKPFDEGTLDKLEIFEDYAKAWIPTFVMAKRSTICIFDFFAGSGHDMTGVPGSPIRILTQINHQVVNILRNGVKVHLYLNAYDDKKGEQEKKSELLKKSCSDYLEQNKDLKRVLVLHYYGKDCKELFWELLPEIDMHPSLVFLDQNGVEFIADKYIMELEKMNETDFLYYVASGYFWRFGDRPEFKAHQEIDLTELKRGGYSKVHRSLIEQLKRKLPAASQLRLYPFSIRKEQNIFGIIFGAKHPLAVDKFLGISWKRNSANGDANYDIDEDAKKDQLDLFGLRKLKKVEQFQQNARSKILSGEITSNQEMLEYVYSEGHIPTHAKDLLRSMKASGEIDFDGSYPLVTYENVYEKKRIIHYKVIKKNQVA